ncbi:hypothetical protein [Nonomuraea africana]|uniref:hypothetical protein n=1 Tax=Nonomuraea africana TaxID=46171 RepID=UPI0033EB6337
MALIGKVGIIGVAVACGLLAAGLTRCGGQEAVSDGGEIQQSLRLRALLSKEPVLPDGFSGRARAAWRSPLTTASQACRAVLDAATGHPPTRALEGHAAVSFQGNVLGELAAVGMAVYAGGEAEGHLEELGRALDSCPKLRGADPASGTRLRLSELALPRLGDEVVSRQLRGRLNGYPYALDLVLVRQGDRLVSLVHTGIGTVDARRTVELAKAFAGVAR